MCIWTFHGRGLKIGWRNLLFCYYLFVRIQIKKIFIWKRWNSVCLSFIELEINEGIENNGCAIFYLKTYVVNVVFLQEYKYEKNVFVTWIFMYSNIQLVKSKSVSIQNCQGVYITKQSGRHWAMHLSVLTSKSPSYNLIMH